MFFQFDLQWETTWLAIKLMIEPHNLKHFYVRNAIAKHIAGKYTKQALPHVVKFGALPFMCKSEEEIPIGKTSTLVEKISY